MQPYFILCNFKYAMRTFRFLCQSKKHKSGQMSPLLLIQEQHTAQPCRHHSHVHSFLFDVNKCFILGVLGFNQIIWILYLMRKGGC